ncbi:CHAP domain-containing protein [Caproiciproducens sp. CPB-2]|uniref:CHAP domain-containing protein n=1 Tax=Caproiciproducens sp. CPB-2 TaxID=3030017 RepID=UPI0023DB8EC0|nr:CHAP domain-containing protein [Caproiciproducens sp. CPB-2]MDF1494547.1 CHAP domain-containing protein [Caproiciproducens sp. CPB-2]
MAKIKTRDTMKDIKVFDRSANMGKHMKNAFVGSKNAVESADRQSEQTQDTEQHTPSEYASDNMTSGARNVAERTVRGLWKNPVKRASENMHKTQENFGGAKRQVQNIKNAVKKSPADLPKKEMVKRTQATTQRTIFRTRQAADTSIKAVGSSGKTIKQAAHDTEKTIKTASKTIKKATNSVQKGIKTTERTAKVTVKTAQQTAKVTQRASQTAAKAAKAASQASRAAAKAAVQTAKVAVKVTISTVKAIIAATKALISAIAAGGWIAVVIILVICMIGLLFGSVFGVFFSGEDSGNGFTMPMAIQEINQEYADRMEEIRNSNPHDDVKLSDSRAEWKGILSVYAVKVNTDLESAQDVATMDDEKKELLRSVFWDMNILDYCTETEEVTEVIVEGDGEDLISTEHTVTKTILYITVSSKNAAEMAEQYGFSVQQKAQLAELLSDEYADLWSAVLYGIHNGSDDIVAVAVSQIGNVNGEPYWSWYGFDDRVEWCAAFVSWCVNECGYIDAGLIPRFAGCQSQGIPWFQERGLWQEPGYIPAPGDIIFFDWEQDGISDHVGIVEYVDGEIVHTVEGNTNNSVARRSYRLDNSDICGYGTPMY